MKYLSHVAAAGLGLSLGWFIYRPVTVTEPPAPEVRQADGSLILKREPGKSPGKLPGMPKGTRATRHAEVTVRSNEPVPEGCPVCPDLHVMLTTVEAPDGSKRVIAQSTNGEIIAGTDIPLEPVKITTPKLWSAGGYYSPLDRGFGGYIQRDVGPLVVGGMAGIADRKADFRAYVGIRF